MLEIAEIEVIRELQFFFTNYSTTLNIIFNFIKLFILFFIYVFLIYIYIYLKTIKLSLYITNSTFSVLFLKKEVDI